MVPYLKSIDSNHLLDVGSEGFYGPSSREKNPNNTLLGGDFIRESQIDGVDFAAFHAYSDPWYKIISHKLEICSSRAKSSIL